MKPLTLTLLLAAAAISGCSLTPPVGYAEALSDWELCGRNPANAWVEAEINRRGLLTEEDWALVRTETTKIGMSECALLGVWGIPHHVNPTTTAYGTRTQLVYRPGGRGEKYVYVYLSGGTVRGWQN